jgi:hypothetical protein
MEMGERVLLKFSKVHLSKISGPNPAPLAARQIGSGVFEA